MAIPLSGPVRRWKFLEHTRLFSELTLPFADIVNLVEPVPFDARTGRGSQRQQFSSHVSSLRREINTGAFTPTTWSANVPPELQKSVQLSSDGTAFTLNLKDGQSLLLTDAGHRRAALLTLHEEWVDSLGKAKTFAERARAEQAVADIEALPITVLLYLNGDPQSDFLNLQKGRSVDKTTVLTMSIERGEFDDPAYPLAKSVADLLHKDRQSPFFGLIQFDSTKPVKDPVRFSTLFARGSSDQGYSLVGLAKVGSYFGMDGKRLANAVVQTFQALKTRAAKESTFECLRHGFPLAPPEAGGKCGSCTMLLGLGVCVAFHMGLLGQSIPGHDILGRAVDAARRTLSEPVRGNFGGPLKRKWLGDFAMDFFRDISGEVHEGLPLLLCQILSAGTFGRVALPRSLQRPEVLA